MVNIPKKFDTGQSPFSVNLTPMQQDSNLLLDWCRLDEAPIFIDGKSVQALIMEDRNLTVPPEGEEMFKDMAQL